MKILSFIVCCILLSGVAFAENSYVKTGSIGKVKEEKIELTKDQLPFRSMKDWIGEKFIFLPTSFSLRHYGYQHIENGIGKYGIPTHPAYKECVGRIGKITSVTGDMSNVVKIKMEDNGQIYTAKGYGGHTIMGIAPILDLDYARNRWIGKTLWYKNISLNIYNESLDKYDVIKIKKYSPVKVLDIVAGFDHNIPIRFIVKTLLGEEGFTDVDLSGTNVSVWKGENNFEDKFFNNDPRITYEWSQKIWSAIEQEKVFVGMTAEQARMSWGEPNSINTTTTSGGDHEQWVYKGRNYIYFDNKILTSIQN